MARIKAIELPDGNTYEVGNKKIWYGTCTTAASTAAKVVSCEGFTAAELEEGTILLVTFSATNSGAVGSLTLNVNDTGAKKIQYINNGTRGNLSSAGYLKENTTYPFIYDGTYWLAQINYNSNTTYAAMTESEMQTGTAVSARSITAERLKQAVEYHSPKEILWAVYGETTFEDVGHAIIEGKEVICVNDQQTTEQYYQLTFYSGSGNYSYYYFNYVDEVNQRIYWAKVNDGDVWSSGYTELQSKLVSGTNIKTVNNTSLLGSGNINTTVAMTDQEIEDAVDAGWIVPNTVTISLTNPRYGSEFVSCDIWGLDSDNPPDENAVLLGEINSPTGSTTVQTNKPYLAVYPLSMASMQIPYYSTSIITTGDVTWDGNRWSDPIVIFAVDGDGTATIDGINYDY